MGWREPGRTEMAQLEDGGRVIVNLMKMNH
jgi:hypothetical protein